MNQKIRDALQLFCDKADELLREPVVDYIKQGGRLGWQLSGTIGGDDASLSYSGPKYAEVKSFAVTLRFFILDRYYNRISRAI